MFLFSLWFFVIILLLLNNLFFGDAHSRTISLSSFTCGLTTLIFWCLREPAARCVKRIVLSPFWFFVIIGSLGAVYVEWVFWQIEQVFGVTGVAASPNFILDLVITMPWYIAMVALFWKVLKKHNYSMKEILILGGIYEVFGDGIAGSFFTGNFLLGAVIGILAIPLFMMVYSPMVIPPAYLFRDKLKVTDSPKHQKGRYLYALLPGIAIPIFIVYLYLLMLLLPLFR